MSSFLEKYEIISFITNRVIIVKEKKYDINNNNSTKICKRFHHGTLYEFEGESTISKLFYDDVEIFEKEKMIILPNFGNIDLHKYTKTKEFRTSATVENYSVLFYLITKEVKKCHDKKVIHGDIKPANFMVMPLNNNNINNNKQNKTKKYIDIKIKLIDFGLSLFVSDASKINHLFGTIGGYIAPEIFKLQLFDTKADIWSLGVLFYIVLTGEDFLFRSNRYIVFNDDVYELYIREKLKLVKIPQFRTLIYHCLRRNPKLRYTAEGLLQCWAKCPFYQENQENISK